MMLLFPLAFWTQLGMACWWSWMGLCAVQSRRKAIREERALCEARTKLCGTICVWARGEGA